MAAIEERALDRGWIVGLAVAVVATLAAPRAGSVALSWGLLLLRDLSVLASGLILVTLGIRRIRARGASARTLAHPILGLALFAALFAAAVANYAEQSMRLASFGGAAPPGYAAQVAALGRVRFFWPILAAVAVALGFGTPLKGAAAKAEPEVLP